jgi:macrodomain Ter protein organizer (MatP/YcbG family)
MPQTKLRTKVLFKQSNDAKVIHSYLLRKLRLDPSYIATNPAQAIQELAQAGNDPERLQDWCEQWLASDQIKGLSKVLRMVSNHQKVNKRTVLLTPRAHFLVKTMSEIEGVNFSELIEAHLESTLREHHKLDLVTEIEEEANQVNYLIAPL